MSIPSTLVVPDIELCFDVNAEEDLDAGHKMSMRGLWVGAFAAYYRSAIKGNLEALGLVGTCYLHGIGVQRDVEKAVYHYEILTSKGVRVGIYDPRFLAQRFPQPPQPNRPPPPPPPHEDVHHR